MKRDFLCASCWLLQIFNLAKLLAHLISEGDLHLNIVKPVDFTRVGPATHLFFTCLLESLFELPALALGDVVRKSLTGKDGTLVRDALLVYLFTSFDARQKLAKQHPQPYKYGAALQRTIELLESV